jgi:hypothetical protein
MVDDEGPSRISRSLSARMRRKEKVSRGEDVPETLEEEQAAANALVPDPTAESDEAGLEAFMETGLPDRLRQMALRRMWRLNPLFRFADEMVEYGENYTDAATVIEGMTTAYQVGKGYLQKAFDALDDEESVAKGDGLPLSGKSPAMRAASQPPMTDDPKEDIDNVVAGNAEKADSDLSEDIAEVPVTGSAEAAVSENASQASQMVQDEPPAEERPRLRPQRMAFRKTSS